MSRPNFAAFKEAHPPRRCVDLQRLTNRRSRSIGFTAPSPSFRLFGLDPDVFRRPASQAILHRPAWIPLVALHSPSRTSSFYPFLATSQLASAVWLPQNHLPWSFLPLRRSHPRNPLPGSALLGSCQLPCSAGFVAGFQTRFVPPSSFFATLTVSSSSSRVVFFIHSRPWGLVARFPHLPPLHRQPSQASPSRRHWFETILQDLFLPSVGVGTRARFSRH